MTDLTQSKLVAQTRFEAPNRTFTERKRFSGRCEPGEAHLQKEIILKQINEKYN